MTRAKVVTLTYKVAIVDQDLLRAFTSHLPKFHDVSRVAWVMENSKPDPRINGCQLVPQDGVIVPWEWEEI